MKKSKKRGYYIYYTVESSFAGVDKKVRNQSRVFGRYFQFHLIVVPKEKSNFVKSVVWRLPFGSYGRRYQEALEKIENPDFIYIRFVPTDRRFLKFIRSLRERFPSARLLLEIATFPYGRELLDDFTMFPYYFKDLWYRRQLKKYIDRIVTFSRDQEIYGIPTIQTMNGILVEEQKVVSGGGRQDVIRLLAVAIFQKSHGYERCIEGLAHYYRKKRNRRIELHMVGEGTELEYYKKLVRSNHLEEYVIFYGRKGGEELDAVYENADIGLGCFGLYKRNINLSSVLKVREYLAKGLPIITGCREDILDRQETEYVYTFPNDSSYVNMKYVVSFYDKIYGKEDRREVHRQIRNYAKEVVDMEKVLQPVIQYLIDG